MPMSRSVLVRFIDRDLVTGQLSCLKTVQHFIASMQPLWRPGLRCVCVYMSMPCCPTSDLTNTNHKNTKPLPLPSKQKAAGPADWRQGGKRAALARTLHNMALIQATPVFPSGIIR